MEIGLLFNFNRWIKIGALQGPEDPVRRTMHGVSKALEMEMFPRRAELYVLYRKEKPHENYLTILHGVKSI